MRLLENAKISYTIHEYEVDENDLSGMHISRQLNMNPDMMFKTIVAKGEKRGYLVFCIPVSCEIDLKKAANAAGDKRCELLPVKELLSVTGYIRGGCSPVGMKKKFPTFIDETAMLYDTITISAGIRGAQLELNPTELVEFLDITVCDIARQESNI